jgi:hypothetical protein
MAEKLEDPMVVQRLVRVEIAEQVATNNSWNATASFVPCLFNLPLHLAR